MVVLRSETLQAPAMTSVALRILGEGGILSDVCKSTTVINEQGEGGILSDVCKSTPVINEQFWP